MPKTTARVATEARDKIRFFTKILQEPCGSRRMISKWHAVELRFESASVSSRNIWAIYWGYASLRSACQECFLTYYSGRCSQEQGTAAAFTEGWEYFLLAAQ